MNNMRNNKIYEGEIVISELTDDMTIETVPGVSLEYGKILLQQNKTRQSLCEKIEAKRTLIAEIGGENLRMSTEIKNHAASILKLKETEKELIDNLSQLKLQSQQLSDTNQELAFEKNYTAVSYQLEVNSLEKKIKDICQTKKELEIGLFNLIRSQNAEPFTTVHIDKDSLNKNVYEYEQIKSIIATVKEVVDGTSEFDSNHASAFKELRTLINNEYLNFKANKLLGVLFRGFNKCAVEFKEIPVLNDVVLKYTDFLYDDTAATISDLTIVISISIRRMINTLRGVHFSPFDVFYSNVPTLIDLYFPELSILNNLIYGRNSINCKTDSIGDAQFARLIVQLAHLATLPNRMLENAAIPDFMILEKLRDNYNEFNDSLTDKIQHIENRQYQIEAERKQREETLRIAEEEKQERLRIARRESEERIRIANEQAKLTQKALEEQERHNAEVEKLKQEQVAAVKKANMLSGERQVRVRFRYRYPYDDEWSFDSCTISMSSYNALLVGGSSSIFNFVRSRFAMSQISEAYMENSIEID